MTTCGHVGSQLEHGLSEAVVGASRQGTAARCHVDSGALEHKRRNLSLSEIYNQ